jgi:diadenosine tetraphosphatase ApaH/serine/threonine PP2A family protein phosphatase
MRIAVLSDIHSNLLALDAVLAHAGDFDAVWHLGDIVGYGPDPDRVVARLAAIDAVGVRGNHEAAALGGPEIDWFNPDAKAAAAWTGRTMSRETRAWLEALPEIVVRDDFTLVHGSPRDPLREYVTSPGIARDNIDLLATTHGLHGHTHVPVAFTLAADLVRTRFPSDGEEADLGDGRSLLNPGSVGQPRDGDPRASYVVLDTAAAAGAATGVATATWHRVPYDIASVQAAIRAAGLPGRLADRLAVGT